MFSAKLVESEMHSGVAFWGQSYMPKEAKDPVKDKAQVHLPGPSGHVPVRLGPVRPVPPRGRHQPDAEVRDVAMKAGKQHDWNDMEILAQGNRIRLAVNGKAVLDWRDPQPDLIKEGPIGLQLHSNKVPQEIHFKGLVLETFPKEDKLMTVK